MEFQWNEAKRKSNLHDHGIDFIEIEQVFEGDTVTILDDRVDNGEERFVTFGLFDSRVVAIAHTETGELIRIISVRKATKSEESRYFKEIAN